MSPTRRRDAVAHLIKPHKVSERRACRLVGRHRWTNRYIPTPEDFELKLVARMIAFAEETRSGATG